MEEDKSNNSSTSTITIISPEKNATNRAHEAYLLTLNSTSKAGIIPRNTLPVGSKKINSNKLVDKIQMAGLLYEDELKKETEAYSAVNTQTKLGTEEAFDGITESCLCKQCVRDSSTNLLEKAMRSML